MKKKLGALLACVLLLISAIPTTGFAATASTDSFFTDSAFLGDSLTVGLYNYVTNKRKSDPGYFSNAKFVARVGYSIAHTLKDDGYYMHPEFQGDLIQPQKTLAELKVKKVFVMLGTNDLVGRGEAAILADYNTLIGRIKNTCPNIKLYVLAIPPMTPTKENARLCNATIDSYNRLLLKYAMAWGATFIDLSSCLKSDEGSMTTAYSGDDYVHISNAGYAVWASALREMVKFEQIEGSSGTAKVINVKSSVNARELPSMDAAVVGQVPKDAEVNIIKKDYVKGWHQIEYASMTGFINKKYLAVSTGGGSGDSFDATIANNDDAVNVRTSPTTNSSVYTTLPKDTIVSVNKKYYNPEWVQIVIDEKLLYISRDFIALPKQ